MQSKLLYLLNKSEIKKIVPAKPVESIINNKGSDKV